MQWAWLVALSSLLAAYASVAGPIDKDATPETVALFEKLNNKRGEHVLIGHQHTTEYGVGWKATDTEDSDVKRTTGAFPAVYGWDFYTPKFMTIDRAPLSMHAHVIAAHRRGGVNTFTWHSGNFATGGDSWDTRPSVAAILPGGEKHGALCADLDLIADFLHSLKDENGALVPVVFRPWHEHNGKWFWWGTPHHCTEAEFSALWRFTVEYLRDVKGVHNILYAWSPNWSFKDEYFVGYPGDEYVDVFGFDAYVPSLKGAVTRVRELVERAEARGKIPAITETGWPDGLTKCTAEKPFTENILAPLRDDPVARRISWLLLWRNADEHHFWVPPPGHKFAADFIEFYQDEWTAFGDESPS